MEFPYEKHLKLIQQGIIDLTIIAKPKESELKGLIYQEIGTDTYAFGVNTGHSLASRDKIQLEDLSGISVLCGTYPYMELPFEKLLAGCNADLQVIPSDINVGSVGIVTRKEECKALLMQALTDILKQEKEVKN